MPFQAPAPLLLLLSRGGEREPIKMPMWPIFQNGLECQCSASSTAQMCSL